MLEFTIGEILLVASLAFCVGVLVAAALDNYLATVVWGSRKEKMGSWNSPTHGPVSNGWLVDRHEW